MEEYSHKLRRKKWQDQLLNLRQQWLVLVPLSLIRLLAIKVGLNHKRGNSDAAQAVHRIQNSHIADVCQTSRTSPIQRVTAAGLPLTDEVKAVEALTVLEGEVYISDELNERGTSRQGPHPSLDLRRSVQHAAHVENQLLRGNNSDALILRRLMHERGLFKALNDLLTRFVKVPRDDFGSKENVADLDKRLLTAIETSRRALAAEDAYNTSAFRADVLGDVLETVASEYAKATESLATAVEEPDCTNDQTDDQYAISYQDARAHLLAIHNLLHSGRSMDGLSADAHTAFTSLLAEKFATLDPPNLNQTARLNEVKDLIERIKRGIVN